jgi:hypothetical protein
VSKENSLRHLLNILFSEGVSLGTPTGWFSLPDYRYSSAVVVDQGKPLHASRPEAGKGRRPSHRRPAILSARVYQQHLWLVPEYDFSPGHRQQSDMCGTREWERSASAARCAQGYPLLSTLLIVTTTEYSMSLAASQHDIITLNCKFWWCTCRSSHVRCQSACDAACPHPIII